MVIFGDLKISNSDLGHAGGLKFTRGNQNMCLLPKRGFVVPYYEVGAYYEQNMSFLH